MSGIKELWLVGVGTGHSVAPFLHTFIARQLGLPWTYSSKEFLSVQQCLQQIRLPICAGCAVTMPWKATVLPMLDEIDSSARLLGACNTISSDDNGRLMGFNTDWIGIASALKECAHTCSDRSQNVHGLIVGAGGAARAAVYALWKDRGVQEIYIINRDEQEVVELERDVEVNYNSSSGAPKLTHIRSTTQASTLKAPFYIVSTVPDDEPQTPEEHHVKSLLAQTLQSSARRGVLLDMCYKPRHTRHIKLAQNAGWQTVQGWRVVGHQAKQQWTAWAGSERAAKLDEIESIYWAALEKEAETNMYINADLMDGEKLVSERSSGTQSIQS